MDQHGVAHLGLWLKCARALRARGRQAAVTAVPPAPRGIVGVTPVVLAERGIYLGPPGIRPAGVPAALALAPVPTTNVAGEGATPTTVPQFSSQQLAVQGDPADGRAAVPASAAVATAVANAAGFVGPVATAEAELVQLVDTYASIEATAWAVPRSGRFELLRGPASTSGTGVLAATTSLPPQTTVIAFIDAVTGKLVSEEAFST